ncbi:MAG TPA: NDMA-dependent alcohol dehydrogenase [Mycobacteriales bacterium]|jgi:S-(hydroxymethyl)glutathione dehydrogenase/alcohol dehydrogenase|nr:NDMA-dependent alcohol dehydrogenase [Mycobacteriales bacterium]
MATKTKGAVLWSLHESWSVEEIEVGDPVAGEVQVRLAASGLCHSDEHVVTGDLPVLRFPVIGGHEGAGVVTKVGAGVTTVAEGDHVVLAFMPACGRCPWCSNGHQNLCDLGARLLGGVAIADGTYRATARGQGLAPMCLLGTFAPYCTVHESSVVKIDESVPLQAAALVGCGVTTGWGSAVTVAKAGPGDTVVVLGVGGIGINAVQGARIAGAARVVAIDPVPFKREQALALGATHAYASVEQALEPLSDISWGRMADKTVIAVGELRAEHIAAAQDLTGKGGTIVATALAGAAQSTVDLNLFKLTLFQQNLQGAIFGGGNPRYDIPNLLRLYGEGTLKLDELITTTYRLEDVNQGYADMKAGRNIRGVISYTDADY